MRLETTGAPRRGADWVCDEIAGSGKGKRGLAQWRALFAFLAAALIGTACAGPAQAIPAFARQTGQECSACHTTIPQLTDFGRQFKMNGYTMVVNPKVMNRFTALFIGGFTHTATAQDQPPLTNSDKTNNLLSLDQVSLLFGGKIANDLGAFAQVTYDPNGKVLSWDNLDVRYARSGKLFGADATYGLSLNNNPTVQDVWATAPAWGFPAFDSAAGPQFSPPTTLLQGTLAQQVLGLTGYAMFNGRLYAEFGAYGGLPEKTASMLGVGGSGFKVTGAAPYGRIAYTTALDKKNSIMVGALAMAADLAPTDPTAEGKDRYVDFGLDSQYDYAGDGYGLTFTARDIYEWQTSSGASPESGAANPQNHLNAIDLTATYSRAVWAVTGALSNVTGSTDSGLYGSNSATNSPNSTAVSLEFDYSPWMDGGPSWDPHGNVKFGAKYTHYLKLYGGTTDFDGSGHNASGNDMLYLYTVLAF